MQHRYKVDKRYVLDSFDSFFKPHFDIQFIIYESEATITAREAMASQIQNKTKRNCSVIFSTILENVPMEIGVNFHMIRHLYASMMPNAIDKSVCSSTRIKALF